MEKHLIDFKENRQYLTGKNHKKQWQYFDFSDNLYPPIKHRFLQLAYDECIPMHDYVNHVRSSQIFGINLFYPILSGDSKVLLKLLNKKSRRNDSEISGFWFEFSPKTDLLGEWHTKSRPDEYVTAVDVLIETKNQDSNAAFLCEIKFTENGFSACGGYASQGNRTKQNCDSWALIASDPKQCYLAQPTKKKSPRKYLDYFPNLATDFIVKGVACPFISNHQCLRNHALAHALKSHNIFGQTFFSLVYHDQNSAIKGEWDKYNNIANNSPELFEVKASEILGTSQDSIHRIYMKERYML